MNDITHIIEHAERHCCGHGTRLTEKRKLVLSALLESSKALSAYELVECCKCDEGSSLSAMSVYRILEFLESEHLVHRLETVNKYVACEHITCNHKHTVSQFLICTECGKVNETTISKAIAEQLAETMAAAGFHMAGSQLEMNCICNDCLEKERQQNEQKHA